MWPTQLRPVHWRARRTTTHTRSPSAPWRGGRGPSCDSWCRRIPTRSAPWPRPHGRHRFGSPSAESHVDLLGDGGLVRIGLELTVELPPNATRTSRDSPSPSSTGPSPPSMPTDDPAAVDSVSQHISARIGYLQATSARSSARTRLRSSDPATGLAVARERPMEPADDRSWHSAFNAWTERRRIASRRPHSRIRIRDRAEPSRSRASAGMSDAHRVGAVVHHPA